MAAPDGVFEFTRSLKCHDSSLDSIVQEHEQTITKREMTSGEECLDAMLLPIIRAFSDNNLSLIKISIKAVGPFPHTQWISELDLDFHAAKVEFRIATPIIPSSFALVYQRIAELSDLKFLHLRYCALSAADEVILAQVVRQNQLQVLFLGVVAMSGSQLMNALEASTSVETLALIWLHMDEPAHDFPVVDFLGRLGAFRSIQNLVLLPFCSTPALWTGLHAGLTASPSIKDIMISGEGGCVINDEVVGNLVGSLNTTVMKRIRLNNVTLDAPGMESVCNFLAASQVYYLDLSGSIMTLSAVNVLENRLGDLDQLRSIDFAEAREAPSRRHFGREYTSSLLKGIHKNIHLVDITLSYLPLTMDLKAHRDFYVQRNRSGPLMMQEERLGIFPHVLEKTSRNGWISLFYHFIRERPDITFTANDNVEPDDDEEPDSKKRAADDDDLAPESDTKKLKVE